MTKCYYNMRNGEAVPSEYLTSQKNKKNRQTRGGTTVGGIFDLPEIFGKRKSRVA